MILSDTIHLSLRNLREAVLRTVLTSLGVAIGIASLVGMVSFGVGLQEQVVGNFLRSGVFDAITVIPSTPALARNLRLRGIAKGRGIPGSSAAAEKAGAPAPTHTPLNDDAVKKIAALDRVKEVYPDIRVPVEIKFEQVSEFSAARGVPMSARGEGIFQTITFGQFFPDDAEDVCMLNLDLARRLTEGEPKDLIGRDISLDYAGTNQGAQPGSVGVVAGVSVQRIEKKFKIVGIIERQAGPAFGSALFSAVMIPLAKAREMGAYDVSSPQNFLRQLSSEPSYTTVTVKVRRPQDTEAVEDKIKAMGFNAFSVADLMRGQRRAFILLDLLLGLIGSIALTVASLGIVNTMVMSILERTREIGIMKAIGGSDEDVRKIFLFEAGLIGLMGGLIGLLLGWIVGRAINFGANIYMQNQGAPAANLFSIPWWLCAGGIGFALLVSLVAGSFPALRAARLDPIQALRHD